MSIGIQIILNILITGSLYALIASGFNVIYGVTRVLHLAHGATILAGSYFFFWMMHDLHAPVAVSIIGAIFFTTILGLLMEVVLYGTMRRRHASGLSLLIATLALLILVTNSLQIFFGSTTKQIGWPQETVVWDVFGVLLTPWQCAIIAVSLLLLFCFAIVLKKTKIGVALRAVQDSVVMSEIIGINSLRIARFSFLFGSFFAGVVAVFWSVEYNLHPQMGITFAIKAFTAAILGGVGSFPGAIFGAYFLSLIENASVWFLPAGWSHAIVFTLLFLFLLFRPQGFFGIKRW